MKIFPRYIFLGIVLWGLSGCGGPHAKRVLTVETGRRVTLALKMTVGELVFMDATERQPFTYVQGGPALVPEMQNVLKGRRSGSRVKGEIDAWQWNPELVGDVKKALFPEGTQFKPGIMLDVPMRSGRTHRAFVLAVTDDAVIVDMNSLLSYDKVHYDAHILNIE